MKNRGEFTEKDFREEEDDDEESFAEIKFGRRAGRPRGTTKISRALSFKYEVLLGFFRFLARKYNMPKNITNRIFFLLEDPTFINYFLRSIERIIKVMVEQFAQQVVGKALGAIAVPGKKKNPAVAQPAMKAITEILKRKTIKRAIAFQFLNLIRIKKYREIFFKKVLELIRTKGEDLKAIKKVLEKKITEKKSVKKKATRKKKNPTICGETKLYIIYPTLQAFEFMENRKPYKLTLQGPAKVYGIEGGAYDKGLLLKGEGLKGFKKNGCTLSAIEAQKGKASLWPEEDFRHDFKIRPEIIILKNGCLLCYKKGKSLHKEFNYD